MTEIPLPWEATPTAEPAPTFRATLAAVIDAGEDFEWYPTTARMIAVVAAKLPKRFDSLLDIGAGDGRVLIALATRAETPPELYAIEKSQVLLQAQPESIIPVGVNFHEQNLAALPATFLFSNPPYSEYEIWATRIIETAFVQRAYLILPHRWKESAPIAAALATRKATATVIHTDTFEDAPRRARAVIEILEICFPMQDDNRYSHRYGPVDPFDQWFDANFTSLDPETPLEEDAAGVDLAKVRGLKTIAELVEAYHEDYARMERNYHAIFQLDYAILKELGVSKDKVREGLKKRMAGLKVQYWQLLFEKLDVITARLSTKTKAAFLERLTGRTTIAFTYDNAYAVVMWAIRHANKYFDQQVIDLFQQLATFEGVRNYKSNRKVWEKRNGWRYNGEDHTHYALDYRIVIEKHAAIFAAEWGEYEYPGHLHTHCHELLDDLIAVFNNLGFGLEAEYRPSRRRSWIGGSWQDFHQPDHETVLFQAKGFKNGNLHLRMLPDAIKALNVEAGRLLRWLQTPEQATEELGYTPEEVRRWFGSNRQLTASTVKQLTAGEER